MLLTLAKLLSISVNVGQPFCWLQISVMSLILSWENSSTLEEEKVALVCWSVPVLSLVINLFFSYGPILCCAPTLVSVQVFVLLFLFWLLFHHIMPCTSFQVSTGLCHWTFCCVFLGEPVSRAPAIHHFPAEVTGTVPGGIQLCCHLCAQF